MKRDPIPEKGVQIGSRWTPERAKVRDTETGYYYERNPQMGFFDLMLQKGLLERPVNTKGEK